MAKINLSIPDDLKERMAEFGDNVNWSAIAKTAFEIEIILLKNFKRPGKEIDHVCVKSRT